MPLPAIAAVAALAGIAALGSRRGSRGALVGLGLMSREEAFSRYTGGQCMWLALALHERAGWPMTVETETQVPAQSLSDFYAEAEAGLHPYVAHVYVVAPGGSHVDIEARACGLHAGGYGNASFAGVPAAELFRLLSASTGKPVAQLFAEWLRARPEAIRAMEQYVLPELPTHLEIL